MVKTKILKVLPFWLIGLVVVLAIQIFGRLAFQQNIGSVEILNTASASSEPQVLGDETTIRGATDAGTEASKVIQLSNSDLSTVSAKSYLVFDLAGGQNLLERNVNQKLSIASLTKLVTGLVAYQNLDFNRDITITKPDILKIKPDLNFETGDSVKASDVFNAMLIGSCNDAALTLANDVASITQKNFIGLMNQMAQNLGMTNSSFANPIGFDSPDNYSTAQDVKALITATQQLAVFKDVGRRTSYEFTGNLGQNYSTLATTRLIQAYPDMQAIKTGFTNEAQGAMTTKITINGHEAVIIVLGSKNREQDTLKLRSALLSDFKWE